MPYLLVVIAGALIAIVLVRMGVVNSKNLASAGYGVLGGVLGIMVLRFLIGPLGIIGGVIGAIVGAALVLYGARALSK